VPGSRTFQIRQNQARGTGRQGMAPRMTELCSTRTSGILAFGSCGQVSRVINEKRLSNFQSDIQSCSSRLRRAVVKGCSRNVRSWKDKQRYRKCRRNSLLNLRKPTRNHRWLLYRSRGGGMPQMTIRRVALVPPTRVAALRS